MINDRVIGNCIEDVYSISGTGLAVTDTKGHVIAATSSVSVPDTETVCDFIRSGDEMSDICGQTFIRINEAECDYVLIADGNRTDTMCARLAAASIRNLIRAYTERLDKNSFFQNLLLDNMLSVDIHNRAKKLHIETSQRRCVFVVEPASPRGSNLMGMIRELFYTEAGDHVTEVDENHVIVIKAVADDDGKDELEETAKMLVDMAGSEAMSDVRVAYGTVAEDIKGVSKSYKEAKMALEVGKIFYPLMRTIEYGNLGVGRLIYQLPVNLCQLFIKEIFGDNIPEEIDDEILATVNKFFENSLNISETSRQLFIHRNTLIYRIEKLHAATGLDIRVFDDALTLKIALMVVNYMNYVKESD